MLDGLDVVVQSAVRGPGELPCRGFTGLPVARPARLNVVDDGSSEAGSTVVALGAALDAAILSLGSAISRKTPPCGGQPSSTLDCQVRNEPAAANLLVWMTGSAPAATPANGQLLDEWINRGWDVACVLPDGAGYDAVVPGRIRDRHALAWRQDPAEVAYDVLACAGLIPAEALLSLARAAFSRGVPIAVPADRIITPMLAHVAAEYSTTVQVERTSPDERRRPLRVYATEFVDPTLDRRERRHARRRNSAQNRDWPDTVG